MVRKKDNYDLEWKSLKYKYATQEGGVNWNFNKYAIQFVQQFNLLP